MPRQVYNKENQKINVLFSPIKKTISYFCYSFQKYVQNVCKRQAKKFHINMQLLNKTDICMICVADEQGYVCVKSGRNKKTSVYMERAADKQLLLQLEYSNLHIFLKMLWIFNYIFQCKV